MASAETALSNRRNAIAEANRSDAAAKLAETERLAEEKGVFGQADIEAYQPTPAVMATRAERREEFLNEITRIIQVELPDADAKPAGPYAAAIDLVEKDL